MTKSPTAPTIDHQSFCLCGGCTSWQETWILPFITKLPALSAPSAPWPKAGGSPCLHILPCSTSGTAAHLEPQHIWNHSPGTELCPRTTAAPRRLSQRFTHRLKLLHTPKAGLFQTNSGTRNGRQCTSWMLQQGSCWYLQQVRDNTKQLGFK